MGNIVPNCINRSHLMNRCFLTPDLIITVNTDEISEESKTDAEAKRIEQQEKDDKMFEESNADTKKMVDERMEALKADLGNVNSKLVSIRFKIERKCIKNEAREERR